MVDKQKKPIELLPNYLRTETLNKVFEATANHLFQPSNVSFINGYIGSKPPWYNKEKDFYIEEPTKTRADYQLSPTSVSVNYLNGNVTNALFYDDLVDQLRFQGAITTNHSRLFESEYYSWSPPIDVDKFVNFGNYYWLPSGPDAILLLNTTDLINDLVGPQYSYTGTWKLSSTNEIVTGTLEFASGMKIIPTADETLSINNKEFFIEGVGRKIELVIIDPFYADPAWDIFGWDLYGWDGDSTLLEKQYFTIGRGAKDGNQWSMTNRWFNRSVVEISKTYIADRYNVQGRRPILEFDAGIELWKYGTFNRGSVDILDNTNADILGTIVGQPSWTIQGIELQDGMKILATVDDHPNVNNRIYLVSGISSGAIQLTLVNNGQNPTGAPARGDRVIIKFGSESLQGKNTYFNGNIWAIDGQQRFGIFPPLFMLYDTDHNSLDDPSIYPSSTFAGSKVFSYQLSDVRAIDSELGMPVNLDQFGDYLFDNNLQIDTVQYVLDNITRTYEGYKFAKINGFNHIEYINGWYKAPTPSRQYIVDRYTITGDTTEFLLDQVPAIRIPDTLPSIFVSVIYQNQTEKLLNQGVDYTLTQNVVSLSIPVVSGDVVIIKTWGLNPPQNISGYYEIPKNLSANPNNLPVTTVTRSQIIPQFTQIIQNQYGFVGNGIGVNNYGNTSQVRGLGLSILQHRAPLIKLSLMNSTALSDIIGTQSNIDPMLAMQWAERSYVRFYNRFLQVLFLLYKNVTLTGNSTPNEWINSALSQINVGKTKSSPWANSGPTSLPGSYCSLEQTSPTYVPASATRLGITSAYEPMVFYDTSYTTPRLTIQTHTGGLMVMVDDQGQPLGTILHDQLSTTNPTQLTNPVAAAWLQFELNLYNSLPLSYRNSEIMPVFDIRTITPGKWRKTDYTQSEYLDITRPMFDKWIITNQVDYRANTGYDTTNQFSYNYHNVYDKQGQPVPGHWQGMYKWFYDTSRPHLAPWEMLGFSIKPQWWENEYGPAPYTSGNIAMWEDLRDGYVRNGLREGINIEWARPGLLSCIPVDAQGNLLPPFLAGCVNSLPSVSDASAEWQYGDGSPIETVWINSLDYSFVMAQTGYLMKPARFIEYTWDILRTENVYAEQENNQWIYIDTNSRRSSQQFYVHREKPITLNTGVYIPNESDLAYFGSCGFQHWISEYVVSKGYDVTNYFGNIIRGGNVRLAHKMAGYISTDNLRSIVDSFGEVGYNSRVIPNENINTYLYRSTSIGESVYSGVIVEQVQNGWKIRGYDSVNPIFNIIPSDVNGQKTTVIIGNQRVYEYSVGLDTVSKIQYGVIFSSRQEVFDFLISYGRWLVSQGWIFDQYDADGNVILDWSQSGKEFLFWSQGVWDNGTFITLSPAADSIKYAQEFGNIQYINGIVSGTYPILDRGMLPIESQNIDVIRNDSSIVVKTTNLQGIFLLRLFRTTLENSIFFDNISAFNDIIYDPLYDLRQERIRIYAYRTNGWNGRVNAPGYFLLKNTTSNTWTMTSNFEKSVADISKYFNIEQPVTFNPINPVTGQISQDVTVLGSVDGKSISALAKHITGYQNRAYLQNLLLEDSVEFEFYQGFIKQKGTKSTLEKLLRNNSIIPADSTFEYYEEWLFRNSYYGASSLNNVIDFILPQDKVLNDPQLIRLFSAQDSDISGDNAFDIVPKDPVIITPPESYQDKLFTLRNSFSPDPKTDLPLAGYPLLGETTWLVTTQDELLDLYDKQLDTLQPLQLYDTVWEFISPNSEWISYRISKSLGQIDVTVPSQNTGQPTTILTIQPHGLIDGDICIINGVAGSPIINGTYEIFNVGPQSFQINISTFTQGVGGNIWVYSRTRFSDLFDRDSNSPPDGWLNGDIAYVDAGGIINGAWTVYKMAQGEWTPFRQQALVVASSLITSSQLYDTKTGNQLANVDYFDPAKGRISGIADAEINYKTDYDPAKYTNGNSTGYAISPTEAWSSAQLGLVWWDLSTVRYIDYEQSDDEYRMQNWGKIAPGTSVDVYEWIRSTIPPSDWASYVAEGKSIDTPTGSILPSGSIRNPESPNWTQIVEYDQSGNPTTYYYFWVKNSENGPQVPWRTLTTKLISNLIQDPSASGSPWYAAISSRSIIIGNSYRYLNGIQIFQRINYSSIPNNANVYSDWELMRPDDPYSQPTNQLWQKLTNSLTTFDGLGNDVPDYQLTNLQRYGDLIRPRQTWFIDRVAASKLFIDTFNKMISETITPLVDDSSKIGWLGYFNSEDPEPTGWDYHVSTIEERDALIGIIIPGQTVLVDAVVSTDNLWTLWTYSLSPDIWSLNEKQTYKTSKYWSYIDWYQTGYSQSTVINYTVQIISELDTIQNPSIGTVTKVLDNGTNKWQLYVWTGALWMLVGQQDGSIYVLPTIYDWSEDFGGFDGVSFDSDQFDQFAGIEFQNIIDGIKNAIYSASNSIEINKLFFGMVKYVIAEQGSVDWAVKTSNIVLKGFNQPLEQFNLLPEDLSDSILGYLNEAKPYHVKIRTLITGKNAFDLANIRVVDFDCPPGYVNGEPPNDGSLEWKILDDTYQSWLANYQTNPELIRTIKAQLIFDRIATPSQKLGWGSIWDVLGWDDENIGINYGAIDRINRYYSPTFGMLPKVISQLMIGVDYRGTALSSIGFNIAPGWSVAPWDSLVGWDPDEYSIESYIDQIIHGGQIPMYDTAIGNGIRRSFELLQNTSSPLNLVVWSDGNIKQYGIDWIVPTSANAVDIISGGSGYSVGQQLDLIAGSGLVATRIVITSVSGGSITGISILGQGSYQTVFDGPYFAQYAPSSLGIGTGATFDINWNCTSIEFTSPPLSSPVPNVYILYIGTTFGPAPDGEEDTIYSGDNFVIPHVDENHPEELYPSRITDTVMLDTYTASAGGRPIVATRVYQTDGTQDQFDISIKPEDNAAIMVYLNGILQIPGLAGDYVVNYVTNKVVFIIPPPIGLLRITSIAAGGGSRTVYKVYVSDLGEGYLPNDQITLEGGAGFPAEITLTSVRSVSASVVNQGIGYQVNDKLVIDGGTLSTSEEVASVFNVDSVTVVGATPNINGSGYLINDTLTINGPGYETPVILRVSAVGVGGSIAALTIIQDGKYISENAPSIGIGPVSQTSINGVGATVNLEWGIKLVSLFSGGSYSSVPTNPVDVSGTGVGATLNVKYGANDAAISNPGLYTRVPVNLSTQSSTSSTGGVGATWSLEFTKRLNTYVFEGDGTTTDFTILGITASYPEGLIAMVDGVLTDISRIIDGIRVPFAPPIGSTIVVSTFTTAQFSTITETNINVVNSGTLTYQMVRGQYHTLPNYLGITVRKNGDLIEPALMQMITGNGYTRIWPITIDITSGVIFDVQVYVDSILQTVGTDYSISGGYVEFTYSPADDATISIVCIKDTTNYYVFVSSNDSYITFIPGVISNGDNILVTTYSEDIDYGFYTEEFDGKGPGWDIVAWDIYGWDANINNAFRLAKDPYDLLAITVWVNNKLQTPMYDYVVNRQSIPAGWDILSWDTSGFDEGIDEYVEVDFGGNKAGLETDRVVINYMSGLPERDAIAWRTLITDSSVDSIAIDNDRKTIILSNVTTTSSMIEIEDYTKLSIPTGGQSESMYINDELISYFEIVQAPTIEYPNRGFVTSLVRNVKGTNGSPRARYSALFYDGNDLRIYFPTESVNEALSETVWVDEKLQRPNIDYIIVLDPPSLPAGRYAKMNVPPQSGFKNVKIISMNYDDIGETLSHIELSTVIDAGTETQLPTGYQWEPAPLGLQYNRTELASFLLEHSGTRS